MKKIALCRISDVEPLRSILPMLDVAGYDCVLPNKRLRNQLRDLGCRNVDDPEDMVSRWGCEPLPPLKEVGPEALDTCDLYVDVTACLNGRLISEKWPRIAKRSLCYFINGGEPRDTPDKGDCRTPWCPVVTTAQHYRAKLWCPGPHPNLEGFSCDDPPNPRGYWQNTRLVHPRQAFVDNEPAIIDGKEVWLCPWGCGPMRPAPWTDRTYVFWPAFTRYDEVKRRTTGPYEAPVSFVHNCLSWGCQAFVEPARRLGVKAYGGGNSPDGLVRHEQCLDILGRALCVVYLKGGGAVDYSILEPMAAGCPVTVHESYIHNCRLYDLLIPGRTCLTWYDEKSLAEAIEVLRDPAINAQIGYNGGERSRQLQWSKNCKSETDSFVAWIGRMFP